MRAVPDAIKPDFSIVEIPYLLLNPRHHDINITVFTEAPVHVEPGPRRREAVTISGGRRNAGHIQGEVRPGHRGGVEHVKVVVDVCVGRKCGGLYSNFANFEFSSFS